ncbi:MAG: hypothetical protein OEZ23_00225, partial [Gammaproteobacteria bacterium]|nr:hypothetical protein [Gammaproteobacteria bacterium]
MDKRDHDALEIIDPLLAQTGIRWAPLAATCLNAKQLHLWVQTAITLSQGGWRSRQLAGLYLEKSACALQSIAPAARTAFLTLPVALKTISTTQASGFLHDALSIFTTLPLDSHARFIAYVSAHSENDKARVWQILNQPLDFFADLSGAPLKNDKAQGLPFSAHNRLLHLYAEALCGKPVTVEPLSVLNDRHIGWSIKGGATTDGHGIQVPDAIDLFEDPNSNLQAYKVQIAHQAGRLCFGSFDYSPGESGRYITDLPFRQTAPQGQRGNAFTAMQQFFDDFSNRPLITWLFTLAEDYRIDALVWQEYAGLQPWMRRLKQHAIRQLPVPYTLGWQQLFLLNLLLASLGGSR